MAKKRTRASFILHEMKKMPEACIYNKYFLIASRDCRKSRKRGKKGKTIKINSQADCKVKREGKILSLYHAFSIIS